MLNLHCPRIIAMRLVTGQTFDLLTREEITMIFLCLSNLISSLMSWKRYIPDLDFKVKSKFTQYSNV